MTEQIHAVGKELSQIVKKYILEGKGLIEPHPNETVALVQKHVWDVHGENPLSKIGLQLVIDHLRALDTSELEIAADGQTLTLTSVFEWRLVNNNLLSRQHHPRSR